MSKQKYMVTLIAEGTDADADSLRKYLAQSVANDFNLGCVENVSIQPLEPFTRMRIFLQQEVPYRLTEHIGVEKSCMTDELVSDCIDALCQNSDVMFDYDRFDAFLRETVETLGVPVHTGNDD